MADTPTPSPTAGTTVPNVGTAPPQASQLPADRPQAKPLPTKDYKLKAGARHFHNGEMVESGATVPLTDSQYRAFADKFEPADKQVDKEAPPVPQTPIASTSGFAQDHGAKTGPHAGGGASAGGAPPPPASDQTTDKGGGVTPDNAAGGQKAVSPPPTPDQPAAKGGTPPAGAPKTTP
jgi:hypothetical protein